MKHSRPIKKLGIISLALITSLSFILTGCSDSSNPSEKIVSQGITVDNTIGSSPTENKSNTLTGNLANVGTLRSVPKSVTVTPTPIPTAVPDPVDEDDYDEDYESEEDYAYDSESDYEYDYDDNDDDYSYDYDYDYDYDDYDDDDYDSGYSDIWVWIPRTGHKYHSHDGCSNMKNPSCVTLEEAIDLGYTQCSKCW